jgi:prepilin-type N-terminal cleavage/methylation domain-containing protein
MRSTRHLAGRWPAGYTLTELLVVVTILVLLVATALPVARKVMEGNRTREASRMLQAYFALAKARAVQTGRPCGLFFDLSQPPPGVTDPPHASWGPAQYSSYWPVRHVTKVFLAEIPPPYGGSTNQARATVLATTNGHLLFTVTNTVPANIDLPEMGYLQSLLEVGESVLVRFDYKDPWYKFKVNPDKSVQLDDRFTPGGAVVGFNTPPGYGVPFGQLGSSTSIRGYPFQVLRAPRAVGSALELPRGTCIDMTYSGIGVSGRSFLGGVSLSSPVAGLTILFTPQGGVDSMYLNGVPTSTPENSLFFLVGKTEKAGDPHDPTNPLGAWLPAVFTNPDESNLADPDSLWVVVSRANGQVFTTENMPDQTAAASGYLSYLQRAREAALAGQQMGGQ